MPWWIRKRYPQHEPDAARERDEQIDQQLAEANAKLQQVRAQAHEQRSILETLKKIREENHLSEKIWGQGMGA